MYYSIHREKPSPINDFNDFNFSIHREIWPNVILASAYQIVLDLVLLVVPLVVMAMSYVMVARALWTHDLMQTCEPSTPLSGEMCS